MVEILTMLYKIYTGFVWTKEQQKTPNKKKEGIL
jgi:hypothetical protein